MGKGLIEGGGTDGRYNVLIKYKRDVLDAEISSLEEKIASLEGKIAALEDGYEKTIATLQKICLQKRKDYLGINMPNDFTDDVWCVDFTEDLSGEVGTIEVLGEIGGNEEIVLQPGFEGNAEYDTARDGQILPGIGATPEQFYYNLAMLPGWQKWRPLYRFATITSINKDNDTATISLQDANSSQQYIDINKVSTLEDVPIEYMDCNGKVFEEGDHVLVKFEGQSWDNPKIIGFREKPKPCKTTLLIAFHIKSGRDVNTNQYFIWDAKNNKIKVPAGNYNDMLDAGYDLSFSWDPITQEFAPYKQGFVNDKKTKKTRGLFTTQGEFQTETIAELEIIEEETITIGEPPYITCYLNMTVLSPGYIDDEGTYVYPVIQYVVSRTWHGENSEGYRLPYPGGGGAPNLEKVVDRIIAKIQGSTGCETIGSTTLTQTNVGLYSYSDSAYPWELLEEGQPVYELMSFDYIYGNNNWCSLKIICNYNDVYTSSLLHIININTEDTETQKEYIILLPLAMVQTNLGVNNAVV